MSILTIHLGVEYLTLSRLDFFQFTLVLGADRTTGHMTMSAIPMVFITVRFTCLLVGCYWQRDGEKLNYSQNTVRALGNVKSLAVSEV